MLSFQVKVTHARKMSLQILTRQITILSVLAPERKGTEFVAGTCWDLLVEPYQYGVVFAIMFYGGHRPGKKSGGRQEPGPSNVVPSSAGPTKS